MAEGNGHADERAGWQQGHTKAGDAVGVIDAIDYENAVIGVRLQDGTDPASFDLGASIALQPFGNRIQIEMAEDGSHVLLKFGVRPDQRGQVALDVITKGVVPIAVSGGAEVAARALHELADDIMANWLASEEGARAAEGTEGD